MLTKNMYRARPTAGIGNEAVAAAVTSIVLTVLAVVASGVPRPRDTTVRAHPKAAMPSPSRPPAVTTTGLGGGSA